MRKSLTAVPLLLAVLVLGATGTALAGWEEGVAAFKAGDYAKAAQEFQGVVEGQPEWPGGHRMLGQTYLKMGRSQDALTHLRKAYDLNPNDLAVQMALGQIFVDA